MKKTNEETTKECKHKFNLLSPGFAIADGEGYDNYISPIFQCEKCLVLFKQNKRDELIKMTQYRCNDIK